MDKDQAQSNSDKRRTDLLHDARRFLSERDYASAADQFAILVEENPKRRDYVVHLVGCRVLAGDMRHARAHMDDARARLDDSSVRQLEAFFVGSENGQSGKGIGAYPALQKDGKHSGNRKEGQTSTPLVSVVVPVYNSARYIEDCLSSVTAQSLKDIELVVVDDGSEDGSAEIIERLAQDDTRIRVLHNEIPSGNPGTPRNQALRLARGRYIAFVDSDDWIEPDMLSRLSNSAEETGADIVFTAGFFDHNRDKTETRRYGWEFTTECALAWRYHESFMIWDKLYRRMFLQANKIALGETKAAVDVPFIFKAYYYANRTEALNGYIGYHYRRETEHSVTFRHRKGSDCDFEIAAYESVEDWFESIEGDSRYRPVIDLRKAMSYIYALSLVRPEAFESLYSKVQKQLKAIDRKRVAKLAAAVGKSKKIDEIDAVRQLEWRDYAAKYRSDMPLGMGDDAEVRSVGTRITPGSKKGVVFLPDWSHRNPYQKLMYAALRNAYDINVTGIQPKAFNEKNLEKLRHYHDCIHVHCEHALYTADDPDSVRAFLNKMANAKKKGFRIIWTVHNRLPHDSHENAVHRMIQKWFAAYCDRILVHGEAEIETVSSDLNIRKDAIEVVPHGWYVGYYPDYISQSVARERLDISSDAFVILFFGNVKPYKGVEHLLEAYRRVSAVRQPTRLLIAGRVFGEDLGALLTTEQERDSSIIVRKEYIPDHFVQYYFRAADVAVLPYKNILTSGVAVLARSFGTPVLAPDIGLLREYLPSNARKLFGSYKEMGKVLRSMANAKVRGRWWLPVNNESGAWAEDELSWHRIVRREPFLSLFGPPVVDYGAKNSADTGQVDSYGAVDEEVVLYRIIGPGLPPLHDDRQAERNVEFILRNELEFDGCQKVWVLNRILDPQQLSRLTLLLERFRQEYFVIDFSWEEYRALDFRYDRLPKVDFLSSQKYRDEPDWKKKRYECAVQEDKNRYAMNNNGARNAALHDGKRRAKWVMPWDGNCFLTSSAWGEIRAAIQSSTYEKYVIVPMYRVSSNEEVLREETGIAPTDEPQVAFQRDSTEEFDESYVYGFKPKVELLLRLGVPGPWDEWTLGYPWNKGEATLGYEAYQYTFAGKVARLASGSANEGAIRDGATRAQNRDEAIATRLRTLDLESCGKRSHDSSLAVYSESKLAEVAKGGDESCGAVRLWLLETAESCLATPPLTVTSKTTLPPSGEIRDYWHPAPYAWPNPETVDGLPYVHRDGERVPGTRMYEEESAKYDRTALQKLFDETTVLALAWYLTGDERFSEKAVGHVRSWFVDERTSMRPHLTYAQVVRGKNDNMGSASGLIETKDFYFFLDALRILKRSPQWTEEDEAAVSRWLEEFLEWLVSSSQGRIERCATNNHGVAYDLQVYSIAAFLGQAERMHEILMRCVGRMEAHFDQSGGQPEELRRTTTAHYTAFNLQLWMNMACVVENTYRYNLFKHERLYEGARGTKRANPIKLGLSWLLAYWDREWPYKQIDEFDWRRRAVLYHMSKGDAPFLQQRHDSEITRLDRLPERFFPHDGIPVAWKLTTRVRHGLESRANPAAGAHESKARDEGAATAR